MKEYGLIVELIDEGDNPILMTDILGGTFVLPEAAKEAYERDTKGWKQTPHAIDNLELCIELNRIAQVLPGSATIEGQNNPLDRLKMTAEQAKRIILDSELPDMTLEYPSRFFQYQFHHKEFTGSGKQLIRQYFKDEKSVIIKKGDVLSNYYRQMMSELSIAIELSSKINRNFSAEQVAHELDSRNINPRRGMMCYKATNTSFSNRNWHEVIRLLKSGFISVEGFSTDNPLQKILSDLGYSDIDAVTASLIGHVFHCDDSEIISLLPQRLRFAIRSLSNTFRGACDPAGNTEEYLDELIDVQNPRPNSGQSLEKLSRSALLRAYVPPGERVTSPDELQQRLGSFTDTTFKLQDILNGFQMKSCSQYFTNVNDEQKRSLLLKLLSQQLAEGRSYAGFRSRKIDVRSVLPDYYLIYGEGKMGWTDTVIINGGTLLQWLNINESEFTNIVERPEAKMAMSVAVSGDDAGFEEVLATCMNEESSLATLEQSEIPNNFLIPANSRIVFQILGTEDVIVYTLSKQGNFSGRGLTISGQKPPITLSDEFLTNNVGYLELPATDGTPKRRISLKRWLDLMNMFL